MPANRWTAEQDARLRADYPHMRTQDLADAMGLRLKPVYERAKNLGIRKTAAYLSSPQAARLRAGNSKGHQARFKPGNVPHNKGVRQPGWAPGRMAETQFKPGRAQRNYKPIGSERITRDGFLERKVNADLPTQRRWVAVQRLVWIAAHGPVPAGHVIAFKPGTKTTVAAEITLDKLECISRVENMRRNTFYRYPQPIPQLIQLRGALSRVINNRSRNREATE